VEFVHKECIDRSQSSYLKNSGEIDFVLIPSKVQLGTGVVQGVHWPSKVSKLRT
jgi:hypothetical protein